MKYWEKGSFHYGKKKTEGREDTANLHYFRVLECRELEGRDEKNKGNFPLKEDKTTFNDYGSEFQVYLDPGSPPLLDYSSDSVSSEEYKWGFILVGIWAAYMDPSDSVMIDILPGTIGDVGKLPTSYDEYPQFYNLLERGIKTKGYDKVPCTKAPYAQNIVPRG